MKSLALKVLSPVLLVAYLSVGIVPVAHSEDWDSKVEIVPLAVTAPGFGARYIEAETVRANRLVLRGIDVGRFLELLIDKLGAKGLMSRDELEAMLKGASIEIVRPE